MKSSILIIVVLLAFASFVHADDWSSPSCSGGDFLSTLTNLPGCIVNAFFSFIVSGLVAALQGLINSSFRFLFAAPDLRAFCGAYNTVLAVLESLFSIALMGVALMFILRSNDVEGRIAAKKWLENLIVLVVLLAFSFMLFQTMLDLNYYLSTSFANDAMASAFTPTASFSSAVFALIILLLAIVLLILTFLTLLLRYILIPFLLLAFPVGLFLYFIPLTKSWGAVLLKIIGIVVFMTTVDALILLGLFSLFNTSDPNLADSFVKALAVLFGFAIIGFANLAMFGMAIQTGVSGALVLVNHPAMLAVRSAVGKVAGK